MMLSAPRISLIATICVHFVLTTWALLADGFCPVFLPNAYLYMNLGAFICGMFAVVHPDSADAVLMYLILHSISFVQDIIFLGVYNWMAHNAIEETPGIEASKKNTYRFALGMAIVNLLIKPVTSFVLLRIYQDRSGLTSDFIPGLPNFSDRSPGGPAASNYQPIDDPRQQIPGAAGSDYQDKPPLQP